MKNPVGYAVPVALLATFLSAVPGAAKEQVAMPKDLPSYGADRPIPIPQVTEKTLPNGLVVWIVPRPGFPKTVALLTARGGTAADPKGMDGLANVLADAVKEGTATRTSRQIAEELQAIGGEIGTAAGEDALTVSVEGLASGTAKILNVVADVVRNASFPADEVELVKTNNLQGLQASEAAPEYPVRKAFAATVFGDHPYRVVYPTEEAIQKVTPDLLKREYARRFRPDRSLLVVAGAVDAAATARMIEKEFGAWKATGEPIAATPQAPAAGERRILVVDRPGAVQSEIRVGRPAVKATDSDYYTLLVANAIFGGAFTSRLTENIREDKGYTYSPGSTALTYEQGGLLSVRAAVRNEVTAATILEIFYELDRMGATEPTEEELARAKRYQSGLFLLRNEVNGGLARTLSSNWVRGLPLKALSEYVPKVNAVTAVQTREVGRKYMTSRTQTVVIGGDAKSVGPAMEAFGPITSVAP
jgi:predicted Zn-dependent peptidase